MKQKVMRGKWELSGRKLLSLESAERGGGLKEVRRRRKPLTIPSTTNVYSTPSATKDRNYCLLEKLYFATLDACRDNRLPNLKIYYLTLRWKCVDMLHRNNILLSKSLSMKMSLDLLLRHYLISPSLTPLPDNKCFCRY